MLKIIGIVLFTAGLYAKTGPAYLVHAEDAAQHGH